jgi:hypothetical protein
VQDRVCPYHDQETRNVDNKKHRDHLRFITGAFDDERISMITNDHLNWNC